MPSETPPAEVDLSQKDSQSKSDTPPQGPGAKASMASSETIEAPVNELKGLALEEEAADSTPPNMTGTTEEGPQSGLTANGVTSDAKSKVGAINVGTEQITVGKKKKKSRSRGGKGISKGTGFEEFFADAPMTPAQAKDNTELYALSNPVDERIQTAVQRFCARRKFDSSLKEVFDRYLIFGGIDAGPNMFGGVDDPDAGDLTAQEIADLKNTKFLNEAVVSGDMVVDFDGVLKAYLSSYSAMWFTQEAQPEIKRRVNVIRSFLNYLLYHDVCPEYKDQIAAAKSTCDVGESQLWLVGECGRNMPGSFNIACSLLFHGWYYDCYMPSSDEAGSELAKRRIEEAQTAVRAALACHGSSTICQKYIEDTQSLKKQPLRKIRTGLEVTQIEFADDDKRQIYAMPFFEGCKSTGKMTARTWWNPASLEPDLTEEEEAGGLTTRPQVSTYEFWIEEDILAKMFCGLRFEADVYELTFGVFFFDQPVNFRCSFFSWIPNEAMIGWRDHVYLPPRDPFPQPELKLITG